MNARLLIDDIHAGTFGGLNDTGLALGMRDMVVVYGPNESGKTTLATLLAWLLVGPTGDNESSLRFGEHGTQVSGRLTGHLDGSLVRIDGNFRLRQKGGPATATYSASLGGDSLTLDSWRSAIGGIDAAVLSNVYRMWGVDLHDDRDVLAEVAQAALAGLSGGVRVDDVAERLRTSSKSLLTATAADAESFASLNSRRSAIESEIREIANTAVSYRSTEGELSSVDERLRAITEQMGELTPRASAIETLLSVDSERRREKAVSEELDALDEVPEAWRSLVADLTCLIEAVAAVDDAIDESRRAGDERHRVTTASGLTADEAEQLRVTYSSVTSVQVSLGDLANRRSALDDAEAEFRAAEETTTTITARAEQALAACPEVPSDHLATYPIDEASVAPLRQALSNWASARDRVSQGDTDLAHQQVRLDEETTLRDLAHGRWERFGTGRSAQQWRATPSSPPVPISVTSPIRPWPVLAIAATVALVAVLLLPRWAAVVVTGTAFAGVVLALRRTSTVDATPAANSGTPADDSMATAANDVVAADAAVDAALNELRRLRSELERRLHAAENARVAAAEQAERLKLALGATPDLTLDLVSRAVTASARLVDLAAARDKYAAAERKVTRCALEVTAVLDDLRRKLAEFGVPERLPIEPAADAIETLRQLTDLVSAHQVADRAELAARTALEDVLAPLGPEASNRPHTVLLADAERFGALHARRTELGSERDTLNNTITTRLRDQPMARGLIKEDRQLEEWKAELDLARSTISDLDAERDQLNQRRGELNNTLNQLANSDELTAKRLELGAVTERADEQLLAGVVSLAARNLLQRVAAERRRSRQPALVERASTLLASVAVDWQQMLVDPDRTGKGAEITVVDSAGGELAATRLSTGARALTHLALRLAMAELDAERRRVRFPIICDDPLVHLDDDRANSVMSLLARAAADGHQVIVFTCHGRTVEAARAIDASVVTIG
jgi:uncharacterized protein YhaN